MLVLVIYSFKILWYTRDIIDKCSKHRFKFQIYHNHDFGQCINWGLKRGKDATNDAQKKVLKWKLFQVLMGEKQ